MTDWLHCNKCYAKGQSDAKMFLVECGHILCEKCVERVGDQKCLICQKSNSIIPIDKDMHPPTQQFFLPFEVHIKKIVEIYNFQMMHRQRLHQAQAEKYQYAKGQLFSCYNKLKGATSENKMLKNMLLNSNRNACSMTSTPCMSNDGASDFTPFVQKSKPIPGYAQRMHKVNGTMREIPNQQNPPINRNSGFNPSNPTMNNDNNMSQTDCGTEASMPLCTPMIEKNKQMVQYSQAYPNFGPNLKGMPIPHNQPHLNSGGMYYRSSPLSAQNLAHRRRLYMASVHGEHIPPNTANSMRQLHGKTVHKNSS